MTKVERLLIKSPPVSFLLKKSKRWILPGFDGVPLYDVLAFFSQQVKKIGFSTRAAAISFNALMALPAALIFLCTLVPYLPKAIHFEKELLITLRQIISDFKTYRLLADVIHDFFTTQRSGLLSFSFLAAIFFSSNAMMGVMRTFDRSYFEERRGKFMAKRWTAIKLTSLLILLVLISVLLLATEGALKPFLLKELHLQRSTVRNIIQAVRWTIVLLLNFYSIAFIYKMAPAVKSRWRLASTGAIIACFLTIATSAIFGEWVSQFGRFNKVYGSIGTVLILMNLVYINSLILIIGFEINVSIIALKKKATQQKKEENNLANPNS